MAVDFVNEHSAIAVAELGGNGRNINAARDATRGEWTAQRMMREPGHSPGLCRRGLGTFMSRQAA